jgi:hypothetical protein
MMSRLVRTGLRRGVLEGSRGWLYVGLAAGGLRLLRRAVAPEPTTVYRAELKPGEGLEIRSARRRAT